jgi:formylglycine-generating enzyme required for sulfatase activity
MKIKCLLERTKVPLFLLTILALQIFTPLKLIAQDTRQLERDKSSTTGNKSVEKRTALVIGNSTYKTSPLTNPANDATDMAAALKALDFEVISGVNQSRAEMVRLIRQFGERLKANGGVGLFYYAGHGVQVEGRNYLIPVDASIRSENEVELEAVDTARVLVEMESAGNSLNIVVLDACRNNPFSRSWRSTNDGLAQINAPSGTLIAYSTAPGKVASDGAGRNAPYTAALLKAIKMPDLSLSDVFMQVRAEVQKTTNRQQTPWEASSVTGRFYFIQTAKAEPQPVSDAQIEQQYWDTVKNSQNAADFQGYLKEYPNGRFTALARLIINQYEKSSTTTNPTNNTSVNNITTASKTAGTISKTTLRGGVEISFAYIPAGEFQMGSTNGKDDEKPVHMVRISKSFQMQTTEVTQAQWKAVMGNNPSEYKNCPQCPVEQVSWSGAQKFIAKLNAQNDGNKYRLPTEAEWEYAARAGTTGDYAGVVDSIAWYQSNSGYKSHPVGTKEANAWGLYDMHGNVWEWVQDWYGSYPSETVTDPTGASSGSYRVYRGGSFINLADEMRRSAFRYSHTPSHRNVILGFRMVRY